MTAWIYTAVVVAGLAVGVLLGGCSAYAGGCRVDDCRDIPDTVKTLIREFQEHRGGR